MYLLHDLWEGHITPYERHVRKGSKYAKLLHTSAELVCSCWTAVCGWASVLPY